MASDARVAQRKLGDAVGKEQRYNGERVQAARQLVDEFERLAKLYKMDPSRAGGACFIVLFGKSISVDVDAAEGKVTLRRETALEKPVTRVVPLAFEPLMSKWQGTEIEPEIAPAPGDLLPRKSALTVLVEEVLKLAEYKGQGQNA